MASFLHRLFGRNSGPEILVVDDERSIRKLISLHLQPFGIRVREADSAEAALALIDGGCKFSLCVLDVMLPGMDGIALARAIRSKPGLKLTPLLFISGRFSDLQMEKLRGEFTGAATLAKPIKSDRLKETVQQFLNLPASA